MSRSAKLSTGRGLAIPGLIGNYERVQHGRQFFRFQNTIYS